MTATARARISLALLAALVGALALAATGLLALLFTDELQHVLGRVTGRSRSW
jgi:hypothetical protein